MSGVEAVIPILQGFLSQDAVARRQAHEWLETTPTDTVLSGLLNAFDLSVPSQLRGLAAVLLRNRVASVRAAATRAADESFATQAQFIREQLAPKVLSYLSLEPDAYVRNRLISAVAAVADAGFPGGEEWQDLWILINAWLTRSAEPEGQASDIGADRRLAALGLLGELAGSAATLQVFDAHASALVDFLLQSLNEATAFEEKRAAFSLVAAIDDGISSKNSETAFISKVFHSKVKAPPRFVGTKKFLRKLLPAMLSTLKHITDLSFQGQPQAIQQLEALLTISTEITEADGVFWANHLSDFFSVMQPVVLSAAMPFACRQQALRAFMKTVASIVRRAVSKPLNEPPGKLPAVEAEGIKAVCRLVHDVAVSSTTFMESETEWLRHREDAPIDLESDDLLDTMAQLVGEFLHNSSCQVVDAAMLAQALELVWTKSPVSCVTGLRILSQLISERPSSIQNIANQFLTVLLERLGAVEDVARDMRCRWWILMVLCDLFGAGASDLEVTELRTALERLCVTIKSEQIVRCKCRALTALFTLLVSVEEETGRVVVSDLLDLLLADIVVPAIQSESDEIKELGFAMAAALVQASGSEFARYYSLCMDAVKAVLRGVLTAQQTGTVADATKEFFLCDAAIALGSKLCTCVEADTREGDLISLAGQFVGMMEVLACREEPSVDTTLAMPAVLRGIDSLVAELKEGFAPYLERYANCVWKTLEQDDQAEFSAAMPGDLPGQSDLIDLSTIGRFARGKIECAEQSGTTQISIKGRDGRQRVFEFKTQIIEEKGAALESVAEMMATVGTAWLPFISKTVGFLLRETKSPYKSIRAPAFDACGRVVGSVLPTEAEAFVARSQSRCALATGAITAADFFQLVQTLHRHLLDIIATMTEDRAAEAFPALEDICESLYEASLLGYRLEGKAAEEFLDHFFVGLGKRMTATTARDLEQAAEQTANAEALIGGESGGDGDDWENACSESSKSSDDEREPEDIIYGGTMRCFGNLMKIYGSHCVALFEKHLETGFSGLLAVPDANMAGRAAALCAFGLVLEYGGQPVRDRLAGPLFPVALLYTRCNDMSDGISIAMRDDGFVDDRDVERIQAAAYCVGVIAQVAPGVFKTQLQEAMTVLRDVLHHPQAKAPERRVASECAVGAIIKAILNDDMREQLERAGVGFGDLAQLLLEWVPFEADEDESRTIIDVLVSSVLQPGTPNILKNQRVAMELKRVFEDLLEQMALEPSTRSDLVNKETLLGGSLQRALGVVQGALTPLQP